MSKPIQEIPLFVDSSINEGTLLNSLSGILLRFTITIFKFFGAVVWFILNSQWILIKSFIASLQVPLFLLKSTPKAIFSFLIAPFHLLPQITGAIRLLFRFIFDQPLVIISAAALYVWLFYSLVASRDTRVGQIFDTFYNFLFWVPIYSIILIDLSNLVPLRILYDTLEEFSYSSPWSAVFVFLFTFKFLKIVVHLFSYNFLTSYKLPPLDSTVLPSDVTVIIPTVGDFGPEFIQTVQSSLDNNPAKIIVSTVGTENLIQARRVIEQIMRTRGLPGQTIEVAAIHEPSKRAQCVHASVAVKTNLIAYVDDHVVWPPTFLRSVLAEFEDPGVGIVGTCKRVKRERGNTWSDSIRNFIACIYVERHNFETTSTYNLDGGVWIISGKTYLVRTDIVQSLEYRQQYLSETFLGVGPINCDDDHFNTRYMVNHGWKTVFHNRPQAMIRTSLGTSGGWTKFSQQLLRWARSIWRSNFKTLFVDGKCWKAAPWTSYAMFLSSLFNISIIYDPLLFISLFKSQFYTPDSYAGEYLAWALLLSKLTKSWNFHMRNKRDIIWTIPVEIIFGYFHGTIRLIALFTCRDIR
ncbi:hypothetical protein EYC80_000365 [Monilinia laxa]|uniref:Glycosyltransferase 2-like domain-containing protein n=1 Tax=Monilinia laxa TaxID=61186 RepID=A0A5N6KAD8_MONLA|nr:hypothetical protein EYC80_000365 [Monilinia laxa]